MAPSSDPTSVPLGGSNSLCCQHKASLAPKGPLLPPCPNQAAQLRLSQLHRLTSSRHEINIPPMCSWPACSLALDRLFLLSEMPFSLAVSLVNIPVQARLSNHTLQEAFLDFLSQHFAGPSTIPLHSADEPPRQRLGVSDPIPDKWAFLQCFPILELGHGWLDTDSGFSREWQ